MLDTDVMNILRAQWQKAVSAAVGFFPLLIEDETS